MEPGWARLSRRRVHHTWHRFTLGALLFVGACESKHAPFVGTVSHSQYFEYYDHVAESLCPSLLSLLDQHAQIVGNKLDMSLNQGTAPIRYYKFRDLVDFASSQSDCPSAGGCSFPDALYSSLYFDAHEQTHVYIQRSWGGPSVALLDEGIATALSCDPRPYPPSVEPAKQDWRDLLYDPGLGYPEAGRFVTYLVRTYGWQKLGSLYGRVPDAIALADFEDEFARTYPVSVDQAWSAAQALSWACFTDWVCRASPLNLGPAVPEDCDGEIHRSITVSSRGGVALSLQGADVMLWKDCGADTGPIYVLGGNGLVGTSWTQHWIGLDPGAYSLTLMPPNQVPQSSSRVNLQLQAFLSRPLLGDTCDTAGEVQLFAKDKAQVDLPSVDAINGWIRLTGGGGRSYTVTSSQLIVDQTQNSGSSAKTGSQLELCPSCAPGARCVSLPSATGAVSASVADGSAVHFRNVSATSPVSEGSPGASLSFVPSR